MKQVVDGNRERFRHIARTEAADYIGGLKEGRFQGYSAEPEEIAYEWARGEQGMAEYLYDRIVCGGYYDDDRAVRFTGKETMMDEITDAIRDAMISK